MDPSLTSSNLSDGLLIFSAPLGEQQEVPSLLMLTISSHITSQSNRLFFSAAPLGEQQEARGLGRHLGAGAAGGQGDEGHPGQGHPDNHGDHCVKRAPLLYFIRSLVALSFKVVSE